MTLGCVVQKFPRRVLSSLLRQKREEGQEQHGPASILAACRGDGGRQNVLVNSSEQRIRVRASGQQILPRPARFHLPSLSPRPQAWFGGWPKFAGPKELAVHRALSVTDVSCGKPHRELRGITHGRQFATRVAPLFSNRILVHSVGTSRQDPQGMAFSIQKKK